MVSGLAIVAISARAFLPSCVPSLGEVPDDHHPQLHAPRDLLAEDAILGDQVRIAQPDSSSTDA